MAVPQNGKYAIRIDGVATWNPTANFAYLTNYQDAPDGPSIEMPEVTGSGIQIAPGIVLTAAHVARDTQGHIAQDTYVADPAYTGGNSVDPNDIAVIKYKGLT